MENVYYGIAIVFYGLFFIRFILSWVGGDFELDTDADLDISDVVSFKGFTHFMMGLSGWLSTKSLISTVQWYDYIIAIVVGFIFIIALYYVYKLMISLESKPTVLYGKYLVGRSGKVYLFIGKRDVNKFMYSVTVDNGLGTTEVNGYSTRPFKTGDLVILSEYDGKNYKLI